MIKELSRPNSVFFLHLLGIDTNGHAHCPESEEYMRNIQLVDTGVQRIYELFEKVFPDKSTAYLFTSDHGMSNKSSHGDGQRANTHTPYIAWGAGLTSWNGTELPDTEDSLFGKSEPEENQLEDQSPEKSWGLSEFQSTRHDVHQVDLAPLMVGNYGYLKDWFQISLQ